MGAHTQRRRLLRGGILLGGSGSCNLMAPDLLTTHPHVTGQVIHVVLQSLSRNLVQQLEFAVIVLVRS